MVTRRKLMKREHGVCHICGEKITRYSQSSRDHVIPLAEGGPKGAANIKLAHKTCNQLKGRRSLEETRRELFPRILKRG